MNAVMTTVAAAIIATVSVWSFFNLRPLLRSWMAAREEARATHKSRAAAHEAGHVVIAWVSLDIRSVDGAWIKPTGEGETKYTPSKRRYSERHLWEMLELDIAGAAGESVAYERLSPCFMSGDLKCAIRHARRLLKRHGAATLANCLPEDLLHRRPSGIEYALADLTAEESAVIVAAFHRARRRIKLNKAAFGRVREALERDGRIDARKIASFFGPRTWAPYR